MIRKAKHLVPNNDSPTMEDWMNDPLLNQGNTGDQYRGAIRMQRLKGFDADNHREMIKNLDAQMEAPAADNPSAPKIEQIK
jgi:hypothetical protein